MKKKKVSLKDYILNRRWAIILLIVLCCLGVGFVILGVYYLIVGIAQLAQGFMHNWYGDSEE